MIHAFQLFENNIVYDANADSLHVFSDTAAEILSAADKIAAAKSIDPAEIFTSASLGADSTDRDPDFENIFRDIVFMRGASESIDAYNEIRDLINEGQLYAPDEAEPDIASLEATYVFKSLCMHLAHDCNMRCAYCFASGGEFGMKRELMSFETARAAIDFITAASPGRTNIEIDFFGGEPLLNFDVMKRVIDYAKESGRISGKNFRFTLTTNALLLDGYKIDYINNNIDNLVLSIDGRRTVHDAARARIDGSGTYGEVVANISSAICNREASWYVRGTYTAKNLDFANDVLHLADMGFNRVSIEPVVSPPVPELAFAPRDAAVIAAEYERLAWALYDRDVHGKPIDFFHFNIDIEGGPCPARRIKGCGAGYEYAAVTPDGGIYPCHQFAGAERFRLGDVFNGVQSDSVTGQFKKSSLYSKSECRACWAKFLCGGGCAANAWLYNGDINKPNDFYCAILRKRMECALWLKCARHISPAPASKT